jgi:hypothetical protein
MTSRAPRPLSTSALLAAVLVLSQPRQVAKADDSLDYKYENYREEDGRITVQTQSGSVDQDVGTFGHLSFTGTIDAVSGATPTGQPAPPGSDQVVMGEIHTRRKAWSGDYAQQIKNVNLSVGYANSREDDYVSSGWSVLSLIDLNQKNTTVRAGVAGTDDRVEVFFTPTQTYVPKHTNDYIIGVTQLIDPNTFATLNFTWGHADGYLSEPHKFVTKSIEIVQNIFLLESFGENAPNERDHATLYGSLDHSFASLHGAVEASYRFYSDTWGVVAHTVELDWHQHLGDRFILSPDVRFYQQNAANFYYYNLNNTPIIPVREPFAEAGGPNYSSDFRLSAFQDVEYGLKLEWKAAEHLRFDIAYERYQMWGTDGVTPQSAYPTAGITTLGAKFTW